MKSKLYRYMSANKTKRYVDVLDRIVSGINNSVSRTHGMKPANVTKKHEETIFKKLFPEYIPRAQRRYKYMFNVGDLVRYSKFRSPFHKSYRGNYSDEVFVISERIPRSPPVYRIKTKDDEEIEGTWYGPELIGVSEKEEF